MARPTSRSLQRVRRSALVALLLTGLGATAGCAEATNDEAVRVRAAGTTDAAGASDATGAEQATDVAGLTPQSVRAAGITFEVSAPHAATVDPGPLLPLPVLPPAPPAPPAPPPPPAAEVSAPDAPTTP